MLNIKNERNNITRYIAYFIVMLLLAMQGVDSDIMSLHTGFFVALVFAGQNVIAVTIIYLVSSIIAKPTIYTLIITLVPAFAMNMAKFILIRLHRRMTIFVATMVGTFSLLPLLVVSILRDGNLVIGLMSLVVTTIFTYLSIVSVFAIVVKKLRYSLTTDEVIACLVVLALMSMGLYNLDVYGFRIYYAIMTLGILLLVSVFDMTPTLLIMLAFGMGGTLAMRDMAIVGMAVIMTLGAYTFIRYNRYFSVVSVVALDVVGGTYFGVFSGYDYLHLIAVLIGVVIYMLIPKRYIVYYRNIYKRKDNSTALVDFVNRNRVDIGSRLTSLAMLFDDIEREMTRGEYILTNKRWKECLSERIMCNVCADCPNRDVCFEALGGDTLSQIEPLVDKASITRVTDADVSRFLESRCDRIVDLVGMANAITDKYSRRNVDICNTLDNKRILGEEIGSIGKVIMKMSNGILDGITIDTDLSARIREELNVLGIICHDILVVERKNGDMELTLVVRNVDKDKKAIRRTIEKLARIKLDRCDDRPSNIEGFSVVRFLPRQRYMVSYSTVTIPKEGSKDSGDTTSVVRLGTSRVALTISDGKGSGELANMNSSSTMGIIEKMYKAGFDSDTILSFANRLLSIRNSEDFSAIDMSIVDLTNGSIDFVKLGGVASFIRREQSVDIIEGSSLPLGVLEEAKPSASRRVLSESDIVVMVSDGITDALGIDKVRDTLMNTSVINVDTIARDLVSMATEHGAIDDTTVVAFRLSKS